MFASDNGHDVTNLAMNFYLKASERIQRGFEFTHKSFGEYLAARAMISVARDVVDQNLRRPDYALLDWYKATRTGTLTEEMLSFLGDEMRLAISESENHLRIGDIRLMKKCFEGLVLRVAAEGFPLIATSQSWRSLDVEQAQAECTLWAVLNCCAKAIFSSGDMENFRTVLPWNGQTELYKILQRLRRFSSTGIIFKCLGYLDAEGQHFFDLRAVGANFEYSSLKDAVFISSYIVTPRFDGTDLENCRFYETRLESCDFSKAKVTGIVFHASKLANCEFSIDNKEIVMSAMTFVASSRLTFAEITSQLKILTPADHSIDDAITHMEDHINVLRVLDSTEKRNLVGDFVFEPDDDD
jgi:hypothetical protein